MAQDKVPEKLNEAEEAAMCEALAPIIEQYGLATVQTGLDAIKQSNVWERA